VVVEQDDCRCLLLQGVFEDFPRIDHGLVDDAFLDRLIINDPVLRIEVDHAELFILQTAQGRFAVVHKFARACDLGLLHGLLLEIQRAKVFEQLKRNRRMRTDATDLFKIRHVCVDDALDAAERSQQNGIAKKQFDRFIIMKGFNAGGAILLFQARPVPSVIIGWIRHPAPHRSRCRLAHRPAAYKKFYARRSLTKSQLMSLSITAAR
jgi:hypothetical protein